MSKEKILTKGFMQPNYPLVCPVCLYWRNEERIDKISNVGIHVDVNNIGMKWYCCEKCLYEVMFYKLSNNAEKYQKRLNYSFLNHKDFTHLSINRLNELFGKEIVDKAISSNS